VVLFVAIVPLVDAQTVQVSTNKKTYNYGDYLEITVSVSEITENTAIMHIIDAAGKKSTAIPIQIQSLTTTIISPNPFDSMIFKEGNYKIEIQYAGADSSAEFELVDVGNTVLPFGSNVVVPQWSDGAISDYGLLKFLVDKNTIALPEGKMLNENVKIPSWYKKNAIWWSEKKITDGEFVNGLAYLLSHGVVSL
jgi:hypothetical protein